MKPNVRISAVVFFEDKLILVKHKTDEFGEYYLLPGGGWDHAESIEECAIREVREECGLEVEIDHLAFYKSVYTEDDDTLDIIFKCNVIGGKIENLDPDNKVKSIDLIENKEELSKLNFHPKQLKDKIFNNESSTKAQSLGKAQYPE